MEEKRRIEEALGVLDGLKLLAVAQEEIATMRMRMARGSVLASRDFLESLSEVFYNVKSNYKKLLEAQIQKNKDNIINDLNVSTLPNNGKNVLILLSANNKLYGDIIPNVFHLFREEYNKSDSNTDIVIVGKTGKEMYETGLKKPYKYFEILDTEQSIEPIKPLVKYIAEYKNITVVYGEFLSFARQEAISKNISGELKPTISQKNVKEYNYIIEPSIEVVLHFFETQVIFSFFNQSVHEGELARHASRIKIMESAIETMTTEIDHLNRDRSRVKNMISNRKQLDRIAGISLWNK